ncbi:MAG: membrane AbrB-like protein [Glaciecola sp.]|jgi:membrane AbrB-like protein
MKRPIPDSVRSPDGGWWIAKLIALFVLATGAGRIFEHMGAPLPWMIGPLVFTAVVFIALDPQFTVPNWLRPLGQVVVATQVGLAFSPEALDVLLGYAPVIISTALATALCIGAVSVLMARMTGQKLAQAFLSSVPTSPVEAAAMAAAAGIDPAPVVFSQTLRLSAVVVVLPFSLYAIEGWPEVQQTIVSISEIDPMNVLFLVAAGIVGALFARILRVPNPNFLGPMTIAAILSVAAIGPAPYPPALLAMGQVILGTWLGATFRRSFLTSALRMTLISMTSSLLLLLLCSLSGLAIAYLSGLNWQTVVLGAAPGGVVEMALTAKFLQQNVVLITTFHLVRIFIFMPNIPWIVRIIVRHDEDLPAKAPKP